MNIFQEHISGWPGYRMSSGDVSVGFVPDIGGRIMSLMWRGQELFYAHGPEAGKNYDFPAVEDWGRFKKDFGFRIFGGDKTWVAPEKDWQGGIPPLELDAGRYAFTLEDGAVVMTSPVCRETGLQIRRHVSLDGEGTLTLREELFNCGSHEVKKGIWNVTQIRKPFDVFVPAALKDVRSYHHEDPTLPVPEAVPVEQGGWVRIPSSGSGCYKFGAMLSRGEAVIVKATAQGKVACSRLFETASDKPYAHRSVVEVFNSAQYDYGECEVHSPLGALMPGGRIFLAQKWRLTPVREHFPGYD